MMENKNRSDEELAKEAMRALDDSRTISQLFERYEPTIRAIASGYYVAGGDSDDVLQEGRLGLFKALMNYDPKKSDSFKPFAIMCIRRQIQSAALSASRRKHMPLNTYVSFYTPSRDDSDDSGVLEVPEGEEKNPENILIDRESREDMDDIISHVLNPSEIEVLQLYIAENSYKEIAQKAGKTVKAVDNMLQSIKRKLKHKIK